nr:uncharacterized protein LOC113697792 isoform X2 [Coffea arabica]
MPFSISITSTALPNLFTHSSHSCFQSQFNFVSILDSNKNFLPLSKLAYSAAATAAAKPQSGPVKKRPPAPNSKKKKKPSNEKTSRKRVSNLEVVEEEESQGSYQALPLPKPPAGFVVDEQGRVVLASNKRIATIVDCTNNFPLECVIRRVFRNAQGDECMLLCPVDTDEEVEAILPTAAYALAKIHMHLVYSGFCYTARGGFCYTEDDIFEFRTDDGQDVDGLPTEGIEITCFHLDGSHYMIYTPSDPLLFVAVKDANGILQIAEDELLEDPATISAIDEETEFNALVEEETALIESLLGER